MRSRFSVAIALAVALAIGVDHLALRAESPSGRAPSHHLAHGFRNLDPEASYPLMARARRLLHRAVTGWPARGPALEVMRNDGVELGKNGSEPTITWIGHSTFLIQLDGANILTDPIWSGSTGPVRLAGLRRLVPPGLKFDDLPRIDAVVISHDHWDHLDAPTVRRLARDHRPRFFVPLGLGPWMTRLGVTDVVELDWWQAARLGSLTFASVPAQHASGRLLGDQNLRLWTSWVVVGSDKRLFFAGDTGYHAGLAEIGRRWGPFDLVALPIGGYFSLDRHHPNHLNPEEAVAAFEDLRGRRLVPMHWGTFEINHEPFREPPERLLREAERRGLTATIDVLRPGQTDHW